MCGFEFDLSILLKFSGLLRMAYCTLYTLIVIVTILFSHQTIWILGIELAANQIFREVKILLKRSTK